MAADAGAAAAAAAAAAAPRVEQGPGETRLVAGEVVATFDSASGSLRSLRRGDKVAALSNGPRLVFAKPKNTVAPEWLPFQEEDRASGIRRLAAAQQANTIEIVPDMDKSIAYFKFKLEITADGQHWKTLFDASRRVGDGKQIDFAPQDVLAVRLTGMEGPDGQAVGLKSFRLGTAAARFPALAPATGVSSGVGTDIGGKPAAWLEATRSQGLDQVRWSLTADGAMRLDYRYGLEGAYQYHGVTFDHPEAAMTSVRWLGVGPYRSWQNRMHGGTLGVYDTARNDIQPGASWAYPEFQGFFSALRWARFDTTAGTLTMRTPTPDVFLRIGSPRSDHQHTSVEFPSGDLSFMHAIPAIGSKFLFADQLGPSGQAAIASGTYTGTIVFDFRR